VLGAGAADRDGTGEGAEVGDVEGTGAGADRDGTGLGAGAADRDGTGLGAGAADRDGTGEGAETGDVEATGAGAADRDGTGEGAGRRERVLDRDTVCGCADPDPAGCPPACDADADSASTVPPPTARAAAGTAIHHERQCVMNMSGLQSRVGRCCPSYRRGARPVASSGGKSPASSSPSRTVRPMRAADVPPDQRLESS
jgi:hypothetical protein